MNVTRGERTEYYNTDVYVIHDWKHAGVDTLIIVACTYLSIYKFLFAGRLAEGQ